MGVGNVVLWGLSQGCAAALVAMLTWEGEALGAVVGMCGWLPFRRQLEEIVRGEQAGDVMGGDEEDVFEADTARPVGEGPVENAITWLREELEMPKGQTTMSFQQVPVFLGHGVEDDKVLVDLGSEAAHCLRSLGVNVHWTEYKGLGHWYSKDMLCDIKDFIQRQGKVQVDSP